MRNVALVPERDIFHRRQRHAAHEAGEAGEIFGQHRIALVRHGRGALLAFGEIFLGLQHFGALQMADFGREPLDRRGDDAERREKHGMPVARNDLGRDRLDRKAELFGDMGFDARIDIGEGADRAGNGAGGDLFARRDKPRAGAGELGIGLRRVSARRSRARHGCHASGRCVGRQFMFEARGASARRAARRYRR